MGNIIQMIMNLFFGGNQKKEVKELDKAIKVKDNEVKELEKEVKVLESKKKVNKKEVAKLKRKVTTTKKQIEKASEAEEGDVGLFDFQARWNVVGRVAYTTYKSGVGKNGKPWARKGIVLLDNSGRIAVEGWDNAWPSLFNTLKQGDEIAVLNVSLDAWAIDVKANLEKGSTMHVISRADDN